MSAITAIPRGLINVLINLLGNGKGGWQAIANSIAGVAIVMYLKKAQKVPYFLSFVLCCTHSNTQPLQRSLCARTLRVTATQNMLLCTNCSMRTHLKDLQQLRVTEISSRKGGLLFCLSYASALPAMAVPSALYWRAGAESMRRSE